MLLLTPATTAIADGPGPGPGIGAWADEDSVVTGGGRSVPVKTPSAARPTRETFAWRRVAPTYCGSGEILAASDAPCIDDVAGGTITRTCADGSIALNPLFRRPVDAAGNYTGPWEQIDNGGCPEDPPTTVILTASAFSRLPLTPSALRLQPADGHGLVNADLIVYTDPGTQTLATIVLGTPVTVRATPTRYSWDFGDGTPPLVTTDPGAPYPHHTIARPYTTPGTYQLTLTTTWSGTYQVDSSGPWLPVLGTAVTVSAPQTTQIAEAHTVLVANP